MTLLARPRLRAVAALVGLFVGVTASAPAQAPITLDHVMSAPYPTNLTAAATGERLAWTLNERGLRNIWVAEGPTLTARRLTNYEADDGQELTSVSISADGKWVVYIRGGDFGSNWDDALPVNPVGTPQPVKVEMWAVPFAGGAPVSLGDGLNPVISPKSDVVVFERARQLWSVPIDGSAPARRLFEQRGSATAAQFSPDGSQIPPVTSAQLCWMQIGLGGMPARLRRRSSHIFLV